MLAGVCLTRWIWYIYQHVQRKRLYVYTHQTTTQNIMQAQTKKKNERRVFRSAVIAAKATVHLKSIMGGHSPRDTGKGIELKVGTVHDLEAGLAALPNQG